MSDDDDDDDQEEEFYYTEVEVGIDTSFYMPLSHRLTLSPPPTDIARSSTPMEFDPIFKEHQYGMDRSKAP